MLYSSKKKGCKLSYLYPLSNILFKKNCYSAVDDKRCGGYMSSYCKKTHGVPALFSFFIPGLGQLVKGQVSKAAGIWAALLISLFMSFIGIGFLIEMVVWIAQIYDAYNA